MHKSLFVILVLLCGFISGEVSLDRESGALCSGLG
jgi:hypothetical protein